MSGHPLVPADGYSDATIHIVLDDFGRLGRAYRETDEARADLHTLIEDMLSGQFTRPMRVVAFNTAEGWARDVSEDVARNVVEQARTQERALPEGVREFVDRLLGEDVGAEHPHFRRRAD
jgi:hypothetical protein